MINRYIRWALVGAVIVGLTHTGTSVGFEGEDWAAWVGAIGTVGTLIGTIYLARSETRRRERSEVAIARLHAANMISRLIHTKAGLQHVCRILQAAGESPADVQFAHQALNIVREIPVWSVNEFLPLIPLPNAVSLNLATITGRIAMLEKILSALIRNAQMQTDEDRSETARTFGGHTQQAIDTLSAAIDTCKAAAYGNNVTTAE